MTSPDPESARHSPETVRQTVLGADIKPRLAWESQINSLTRIVVKFMLLDLSSHPTVLLLAHMGEGKVHQLSIFPL